MNDSTWKTMLIVAILAIGTVQSMPQDPMRKQSYSGNGDCFISIVNSPNAQLGERYTMECKVTQNLKNVKYSWYKDGRPIQQDPIIVIDKLREQDLGTYKCKVTGLSFNGLQLELEATSFQRFASNQNQRKESNREEKTSQINVNKYNSYSEYSINIVSNPERFQIGAEFSMKCSVNPQLQDTQYTWIKNGVVVSNDDTLRFDNLQKEDLGSYKCVVTGKTENGFEMTLQATTFQQMSKFESNRIESNNRESNNQVNNNKFSAKSSEYSVNIISSPERFQLGAGFVMQCRVTPQLENVKYTWYKDGRVISHEETMRFDNLQKEDLGSYKCVVTGKTENGFEMTLQATTFQQMSEFETNRIVESNIRESNNQVNNNKFSAKSSEYSVNIISSPERFQLGAGFVMQCRVTPQLENVKYTWYKDGRVISREETMRFDNLQKEDLGSYKCVVTGKTENGFEMTLEASAFQHANVL